MISTNNDSRLILDNDYNVIIFSLPSADDGKATDFQNTVHTMAEQGTVEIEIVLGKYKRWGHISNVNGKRTNELKITRLLENFQTH